MPELPEVETIRLELKKFLIGHKIERVKINFQKSFQGDKKAILGAKIIQIRRFGKVLVIDLNNKYSLLIHLKMSGQLIYQGPNLSPSPQTHAKLSEKILGGLGGKHTHVIFYLDKGGVLYFNDVRKFGWIKVAESSKLKAQNKFIGKLGPEPHVTQGYAGQAFLDFNKFREILAKSSRPIKIVLMDQEKISGIGNIYANDALFLAGINPQKRANKLPSNQVAKLLKATEEVLKEAIKRRGASEDYYVTPEGKEGEYQNHSLVYNREGELCKNCKTPIKKIKLGGRGSYFCPTCQK